MRTAFFAEGAILFAIDLLAGKPWLRHVFFLNAMILSLCSLPCHVQSPQITSVSRISTQQNQTIVIMGSGFGTLNPYTGDSRYILFTDSTNPWSAGFAGVFRGSTVDCFVTLIVES
jgi:hypothetical protein